MLIISGCCKNIYIKNHNLCKTISIILILSFLLGIFVSYLQRRTLKELMCIKKIADILMHAGGPAPPPNLLQRRARGALPLLPPLSPGRGGGWVVNQSCLTADMWFHLVCGNTIPVRSKRSIHCDRVRHATLEWHEGGMRVT